MNGFQNVLHKLTPVSHIGSSVLKKLITLKDMSALSDFMYFATSQLANRSRKLLVCMGLDIMNVRQHPVSCAKLTLYVSRTSESHDVVQSNSCNESEVTSGFV